MSNVNPADETSRSFSSFIATLEDGDFSHDLTEQLRDLVARLNDVYADNGGTPKGKLTIVLDLKLDSGVIEAKGDVKVVMPKLARRKTVLYATPNNYLTRKNPKQQELPGVLRDVTVHTDRDTVRAV